VRLEEICVTVHALVQMIHFLIHYSTREKRTA